MRFRAKLLMIWVATLLLLIAGVLWPLQLTLSSSFERMAHVGFAGSAQSLANLRSERVERLTQAGMLIMNIPDLRALIAEHSFELTPAPENLASLQERLDSLSDLLEVSFICVIDARGKLITQNAESPWQAVERLSDFLHDSPQARAMIGQLFEQSPQRQHTSDTHASRYGLWVHQGSIYQVVGVPLVFGRSAEPTQQQAIDGALLMGVPITDDLATQLGRSHDCEISFLADGGVLSSSLPASDRAELTAVHVGRGAQWPLSKPFHLEFNQQNYLSYMEPLSDACSGRTVGSMLVQSNTAHARTVQQKVWENLGFITLAGLLAAIAISYLLSGAVTRPVRALVEGARRVAKGDLETSLPVTRSDELGELAVAFNDMVRGLRSQQQLRAEVETSRAASQAKSEFLASMSHEIRTPLNGVIGMLELMKQTSLNEQQTRYAQIAKSSADVLLTLINNVLDFSKIEAGKMELETVDFDMGLVVEEVLEVLASKASGKGLELASHIAPELPNPVRGDPDRLRQVLINLVNNAIKFTERGEVVIRLTVQEQSGAHVVLRVEVIDSGIGIPPERMDRLFKSFTQVDASTTRKYGGTGLGLAICKQIVEALGGTIGVESHPGKGSTFWFTARLGCTSQAQTQHDKASMTVSSSPNVRPLPLSISGKYRVAVVDDSSLQCDILRQQLASWGLECHSFSNGKEAVEGLLQAAWHGKPFSLAILDWAMPGMNGLELARAIRNQPAIAELPLVMLTSFEASLSTVELQQAGFKELLTKPLRQSRLMEAIVRATRQGESATAPTAISVLGGHIGTSSSAAQGGNSVAVNHSHIRILLAEDNEVNQMVASELLAKAGYTCRIVSDGRLALECIRAEQFDIVLMDCQMPQMDGFEATAAIRELERTQSRRPVTIIALTANVIKGDQERCLAAGMDAYLTKPLDPAKLIQTVEAALADRTTQSTPEQISRQTSEPNTNNLLQADSRHASSLTDHPIDAHALLDRCMGDVGFLESILEKFRSQSVEYIHEVVRNAQHRDVAALARTSHVLKGMAANLSAPALQAAAARLEEQAILGNLDHIQAVVDELKQQLDRCIDGIPAVIQQVRNEVRPS